MKVQPLDNFVLLELSSEKVNTTELGLILPVTVEPEKGIVKAIGSNCTFAKIGDQAYFGKFAGEEMEIEGKKCLFVREKDLLAVKRDV